MNINTFGSEFLADLEAHVVSPIKHTVLESWDPRCVAAPERHASLGKVTGISADNQLYVLEQQNHAFEVIESMLRHFLTPKLYSSYATIDPVKEQVWLFGQKWLDIYYGLLGHPMILKSEFYKKEHERFLDLLRQMLHPLPAQRLRFLDVLRVWDPTNQFLKPATYADELFAAATAPAVAASVEATATANPSTSVPSVADPSTAHPQQPPPTRHRLVLAPRGGHEVHNKTRKNQRS